VFILDYYWSPPLYFWAEYTTDGYGASWFSHHLPLFFEHGGVITLLPNDKDGALLQMHNTDTRPFHFLNVAPISQHLAAMSHPFYSATDLITDFESGQLRGVACTHGSHRTNASAVKEYLNPTHPFLLVYNITSFFSLQDACAHLWTLQFGQRCN
jgi:hypothetical protein